MATQIFKIPMDKAGRVVLPKQVRDHLHATAGMEFELEELDDAIVLRPIQARAKLVDEGGWLVAYAEVPAALEDIDALITQEREKRNKVQLAGHDD